MTRRRLLVVAGEASGDLHGARLVAELHRLLPGLDCFGLGGDELQAVGLEALGHSREISVVGITEALRVLPRARQLFRTILEEVDRRRPDAAVLIDLPGFNLRLARKLKEKGIPVVYYISPQIWAWRRGRVKTIAKVVEKMLVLFPFEVDFYKQHAVDVVHVGHPLVDEVPQLPQAWDRGTPEGTPFSIALLPGSRMAEVERLLPPMLAAVKMLSRELPIHVCLIKAPTVSSAVLDQAVAPSDVPLNIVDEDRFDAIAESHLALCASGTATLEVAILGTPMIVMYRLNFWTSLFGRMVLRIKLVSLVNLVLERKAVPELLQQEVRPAKVFRLARRLLKDPEAIAAMRSALGEVRSLLGERGASRRAAEAVAGVLGEDPRSVAPGTERPLASLVPPGG